MVPLLRIVFRPRGPSFQPLQLRQLSSVFAVTNGQPQKNFAPKLCGTNEKLCGCVVLSRSWAHDDSKSKLPWPLSALQSSISAHNEKLRNQLMVHKASVVEPVHKVQKKFAVQKENIRTIPNLLTTLRMGSAPVIACLVVGQWYTPAFGLFVLAGITDLLDGFIARNFKNQRSALGTALDPLADKLLMFFLTLSLTSVDLIPVPVTALILGRDAGLILGSFYLRYITLAPPRTLSRYFDISHVSARLYPSLLSKANTMIQLLYVATALAAPVFDFVGHPALQALMYTTAATTFLSGADYAFTWRKRLKIVKNN